MNRRLYRSVADRRIGGVAAGTAAYFDIDPSISRVLWLLLAFFSGGVFFVVYLVMWAIVPEEPYPAAGATPPPAPAPGATSPSGETGEDAAAAVRPAESGSIPAPWPPAAATSSSGPGGRVILGAILILIGAWFLADEFLPWLNWDLVWPIGLVVIGVVILAAALRRKA
ncbi:MAG: PspC domain-containing protein [Candidatus Limnocylindria bacterium]